MKYTILICTLCLIFFLGYVEKTSAYAECWDYYCAGGLCQSYVSTHPDATGCSQLDEVYCYYGPWSEGEYCGISEHLIIPVYSYQYPYPYEYEYQYQYEYQYPYPTPYGTPYGYPTPYGTPYGYPTPYGTPYGYETPYAYPSPAYGYPTPSVYSYQTPYTYPTPAYGYPTPSVYSYETPYAYPTPAVAFNYSLSNGGDITANIGSGNVFVQEAISKTLVAGTSEAVTLSLSGVPTGVSYSLAAGTCSPTCTSTITFTVSPTATVGTHTITVTGSPLSKTTNFNLVIASNPITVTCTVTPSATMLIGESVTWTGGISGGTAPYTYRWAGTNIPTAPAPTTNPYTKTYSTIGTKSATLTVTDNVGIVSSCSAGTVQINFNPAFEEF